MKNAHAENWTLTESCWISEHSHLFSLAGWAKVRGRKSGQINLRWFDGLVERLGWAASELRCHHKKFFYLPAFSCQKTILLSVAAGSTVTPPFSTTRCWEVHNMWAEKVPRDWLFQVQRDQIPSAGLRWGAGWRAVQDSQKVCTH